MVALFALWTLWLASSAAIDLPPLPPGYYSPGLPPWPPTDAPAYMVNNEHNAHGVAPDKGSLNGPILGDLDLQNLLKANPDKLLPKLPIKRATASSYWMSSIAHGQMPLAGSGYQLFRNVVDFGATGDGSTDDTAAINRAAAWVSKTNSQLRCGENCGSTSTKGAVVFFPPGTYVISSPIIQYYYTAFIGDPTNLPVIQGARNFTGIALIDTDPYIPGGNGAEWYINQNQFYRQIRNFKIDLTVMAATNFDKGQKYNATGIHWQVAQATSMQNVHFNMPLSNTTTRSYHVGLFMENGSGGFLSDLTFTGGNIGWRAGSQQYTARNITFTSVSTAISMIWDWGFTWQGLNVISCRVALDCTSLGGIGNQGTGSLSILDSRFSGVPNPIVLRKGGPYPNLILDNLLVDNSAIVVVVDGGEVILPGSSGQIYLNSWGMGSRYLSQSNKYALRTGFIDPAPKKSPGLLNNNGAYFTRSKPTYANVGAGSFVVATANGISNDGTGDQTAAINKLLSGNVGKPIWFPGGIYLVKGTVNVPVGSIIVGEAWSQIMGTGSYFQDANNPKVMVKVGDTGDTGVIEISDMLFTVQGPTAGAILMEWNVHESSQGSAAMWDSHFRVGGATGSNLGIKECPKQSGINKNCAAASLLLHVTSSSSGYFENVWAWVADHDLDSPLNAGNQNDEAGVPQASNVQISVFVARGVLIESQGPSWFYGTASEHCTLYQYSVNNARNIFFGHMQTETPYFQPNPDASQPYPIGEFKTDPKFDDCQRGTSCEEAWALRIISSRDIFIYSAGFYSFFSDYDQGCLKGEKCQLRLVETSYSQGIWLYNLFTKGATQAISPRGGIPPVLQNDTQNGFTTEISAWLVLALSGGNIGSDGQGPGDGSGIVYIGTEIFNTPSPTVGAYPPATLVFPPSSLPSPTTIGFPPVVTTIKSGTVTSTTTITVIPLTTNSISFMPLPVPSGSNSFTFALTPAWSHPPSRITLGTVISTITFPLRTTGYFGTGAGVSSPTGRPTNITEFATLATTSSSINGTLWTFVESQIDTLATIKTTTTTTTTTTITATSSGSVTTTTTPVIIYINTGGFYWSPVPKPTLPVPKFPTLPDFPPIPTPKCFTLFQIFTINCPPNQNKNNPTTTFVSQAPTPTCTQSCGTLPDNSDSSRDSSTSDCKTQTTSTCQTFCQTRPCSTKCATYVGCECQTTTATNYFVSCGTSSCTTTSTNTVTGCSVTGTTTTTGAACPFLTWNSYDNEPTDGRTGTITFATTTVTKPEIANIGNTRYTVTSSRVVVSGTTLTIPALTGAPITTTISGVSMVIYPPTTYPAPIVPTSGDEPVSTGGGNNGGGGGGGGGTTNADSLCSSGQVCIKTTYYTRCARDLPTFAANVTATGEIAVPTQAVQPAIEPVITPAPITDLPYGDHLHGSAIKTVPAAPAENLPADNLPAKLLPAEKKRREWHLPGKARQDGACQSFLACALCATPVKTPCLDVVVVGYGDFDEIVWRVLIKEDGVLTCDVELHCDNCQGATDTYLACDDPGNRVSWYVNKVSYKSKNYGKTYNETVPAVESGTYPCGPFDAVDCTSTAYSAKDGPCSNRKRQVRTAMLLD